ncbi:hypothetical protein WJX74_007883 [Apatococcus lobatus]|uniref:Uncharacterized protein n=1 Tax=Apatococcus lobatus TaxID=904363 RepID=A0AAW1S2V4_9CHLO
MPSTKPDTNLLKAVLAIRVPKLTEDIDFLDFLGEDVLGSEDATALANPDSLHSLLGEHLLSLGACTTDLELQLLSEDLQQDIAQPSESHKELAKALAKGQPLQQALQASHHSAEEDVLPPGSCEMCERLMPLTVHHLYPREIQKKFLKRGLMTDAHRLQKASICRQCHNTIHRLYENEHLALNLNSIDKLLQEDDIQKWVIYARKQKSRAVAGMRVAR